jgi:predicted DNA-binding transcriptional regulator AlpA
MKSQTVDDFCTAHGISRGLFYQLIKRGEAPKTFKIGRCTRISEAAATEWVASREAEAAWNRYRTGSEHPTYNVTGLILQAVSRSGSPNGV